jgi:hypothetical protein
MATFVPSIDHVEAIIRMAKRILDSGLNSEHFATVFEAMMRIQYPQNNRVEVPINFAFDEKTAARLSDDERLKAALGMVLKDIEERNTNS